mmetsp:Transcript_28784/g.51656  ORF Transcript_28784/g.51656 Transcript_28784/m.51656 type:complete len:241 (+) Transcript_28784:1309-2031(+)
MRLGAQTRPARGLRQEVDAFLSRVVKEVGLGLQVRQLRRVWCIIPGGMPQLADVQKRLGRLQVQQSPNGQQLGGRSIRKQVAQGFGLLKCSVELVLGHMCCVGHLQRFGIAQHIEVGFQGHIVVELLGLHQVVTGLLQSAKVEVGAPCPGMPLVVPRVVPGCLKGVAQALAVALKHPVARRPVAVVRRVVGHGVDALRVLVDGLFVVPQAVQLVPQLLVVLRFLAGGRGLCGQCGAGARR